MADFLEQKKREIEARLKELRPLVEEFHRLEAASQALNGVSTPPAAAPRRRRNGSSGSRPTKATTGRRGRPRGTGTRAKEALAIVRAQPGVTIPELAEKMGIKQNYLYRVLPGLAQDGMVSKQGRGWHAKEAA
jgi:sugar-specific transcriptional regulator TrmB